MDKLVMLVGTIGQGIMRSADGGESWQRIGIYQGMHSDPPYASVLDKSINTI